MGIFTIKKLHLLYRFVWAKAVKREHYTNLNETALGKQVAKNIYTISYGKVVVFCEDDNEQNRNR